MYNDPRRQPGRSMVNYARQRNAGAGYRLKRALMEVSGLTIDDLLNLNVVGDAQVAPDGQRVTYAIAENGAEKGHRSPESWIWMHRLDGSTSEQLTFGPGSDRQPRWSSDGRSLTFLSDRETRGQSQVYLLDETPRDARKLTDLPAGVSSHAWSPGGGCIALTATDHFTAQDNDVRLFDSDRWFRRLYCCDVSTGETTPINHGDLHVWEYCWSPDGTELAAIVSDEPFEWGWYSARLVVIDVSTGERRDLYQSDRQIARPAWSPDGSHIALITCRWSDPGMTGGDVIVVRVDDGQAQNLTEDEPRSHFTVHWQGDSRSLISVGLERACARICRIDLDGGTSALWGDDLALTDYGGTFDANSGRLAMTLSGIDAPPEVWTGIASGGASSLQMSQLTTSNQPVDTPPAVGQWLSWRSVDGATIEGLYISPADSPPGGTPPMVTLVHGGPTAAASPAFPLAGAAGWTPFLLQHGVSVFMPNYRGSNGYGVRFAEANVGDLGGLDLQDVLTGIDECGRLGLADVSRLGIGGWSYGGYLTAWAVTQTSRFAGAVAGASITNWFSFHGGTNITGFDGQFIGASPDELDSPYAWVSPLFASQNVRTPTLFVHGENDPCCPVGQAYEMTRALRRRGVAAECAIYPREGHGFIEKAHRRDMVERSVGWFRSCLGIL